MLFRCSKCGRTMPVTTAIPKCECGGLWDIDWEIPSFEESLIDTNIWGMFRYHNFMALDDNACKDITLGEGFTPVIYLDNILYKMDYMMPTLSFKDRGAAVLISHCKSIGVKSVVQDSSGNAGCSVAAYSARAGINCTIYVPEGTPRNKINMITSYGAKVVTVEGDRDHCADICREAALKSDVYYANHVYNPFFYEGTKTYIYEVFEQLHRIPEHLVIPVGNGTLFLGCVYALEHLQKSSQIDHFPHIIAVQSEYCDPLFRAAEIGSNKPVSYSFLPTLAEGIAIGRPMRGKEILRLAYKHNVTFVHAPEGEIKKAKEYLANNGLYIEETTAANLAGFREYCRINGDVKDCLITLCGSGLKTAD